MGCLSPAMSSGSSSPRRRGSSPRQWRTTTRTSTWSSASRAVPLFDAFVAFVRTGPIRRYWGGRYFCVTIDEYDYWLTHGGDAGWIVNRKRTDEAGWDAEPPPTRDARELIWHDVERELISRERAEELVSGL